MTLKPLSTVITLLICAATFFTQNALAQNRPSPLMPLYDCLKIDNETQRLGCLENQTQILRMKEKDREILSLDAQYTQKIREEAFGFYLPSLPQIGIPQFSNANTDISQRQSFNVHSVRKVGRDYVFTMKNGQVWRQSGGRFNFIPNGQLTATITQADMGDYQIQLMSNREQVSGMLVKRIQ